MSARDIPPMAARKPTSIAHHGDIRTDDWFWLRERDNPEVLRYLEAENLYVKNSLLSLEPLREKLFNEFVHRVRETDCSAPTTWGDWNYYHRTFAGLEYPIHCRRPCADQNSLDIEKPIGETEGEEVVLDENVEAAAHDFFELRGFAISPNHQLLAFSSDTTGGERATMCFRGLGDTNDPPDRIENTYGEIAWCNDNRTVLFLRDDDAMRPYQVWRHTLNNLDKPADELIFQEDDERFGIGLHRTRSGRFVIISVESRATSEAYLFDADTVTNPLKKIASRCPGVEYFVDHWRGNEDSEQKTPDPDERLFIVTNVGGATNFQLMECSLSATEMSDWKVVIPNRQDIRLDAIDPFADYLVLTERADGLEQIRVMDLADRSISQLDFTDPVYSVSLGANPQYETSSVRVHYTSLAVPTSDLDFDLKTLASTTVKTQEIFGHNSEQYETLRLYVPAADGVMIPISLVSRRNKPRDGKSALLLYGYGSYEISIDATFSATRLSLLERGFTYAIAHVRGGGELGRDWYEAGKMSRKRNTFSDFIAVADYLIAHGFTSSDRLVARGGSAGGLLMGAVANDRPDLFAGVVAEVPFVDCLNTMLDVTLPLTVPEWEEWGDPLHDAGAYATINSYSPYENVAVQHYPAMLVTAGINDPRVAYWEPAKWVAKLRAVAHDSKNIFLRTELGAGHHGPSGRYQSWKEEADTVAFIIWCVNMSELSL